MNRSPSYFLTLFFVLLLFSACTKEERTPEPLPDPPPRPQTKKLKGEQVAASPAQELFDRARKKAALALLGKAKALLVKITKEATKLCTEAKGAPDRDRRNGFHAECIQQGEQLKNELLRYDPMGSRSALYAPLYSLIREISLLLPATISCPSKGVPPLTVRKIERDLQRMGAYVKGL